MIQTSKLQGCKVIVFAFACEPGDGSEPAVGWNFVLAMSKNHDVTVVTHPSHRKPLDAYLMGHPDVRIRAHYYALPLPLALLHKASLNIYYYLWQLGAARLARRLHSREHFDVAHHVTYARYWMPSAAACLGIPFIWGPVGGGETTPPAFRRELGLRARMAEAIRDLVQRVFEHDPFMLMTARRAAVAYATTEETAARIRRLGVPNVEVLSAIGCNTDLALPQVPPRTETTRVRFVSAGRLLYWKGFQFGLRAFAAANLPDAEMLVLGSGPEERRLKKLARRLGIASCVKFMGELPRFRCLEILQQCDVLVHPSLHDSGGLICLEAMEASLPVICLNLGGPPVHVSEQCGIRITAHNALQTITDLAAAMRRLAEDPQLRRQMGEAARTRATQVFSWQSKVQIFEAAYEKQLLDRARQTAPQSSAPTTPQSRTMALLARLVDIFD